MKVKEGFVVCRVGGKTVAAASGELSAQFNGMITLNETGELLFNRLMKGTTEEELAMLLVGEYGITAEQAKADVSAFLAPLERAGVLLR
ncbi:MAG: PqqD family protein [Clostridia bacterium]|nr:PqqD family protein [Clostridia bacterium]